MGVHSARCRVIASQHLQITLTTKNDPQAAWFNLTVHLHRGHGKLKFLTDAWCIQGLFDI